MSHLTKSITVFCLTAAAVAAQAAPVPNFQGVWQDCFHFKKSDKANYARYGGGDICSGLVLLQKGKNICGTWEDFATHMYSGNIQAVQEKANFARSQRICGRVGSYTQVECDDKATSTAAWENNNKSTLRLSNGRLYFNWGVESTSWAGVGLKRKPLTQKQINELMQDKSIAACLTNNE